MYKESPAKLSGNQTAPNKPNTQRQLSDSNAKNDLKTATRTTNNKMSSTPQAQANGSSSKPDDKSTTPIASPSSSPTKSSPSKSKNKKRNDAKRRSANIKKQQQQQQQHQADHTTESPSKSDKMKPEPLANDSLEKHEPQQTENNLQSIQRNSQTPSLITGCDGGGDGCGRQRQDSHSAPMDANQTPATNPTSEHQTDNQNLSVGLEGGDGGRGNVEASGTNSSNKGATNHGCNNGNGHENGQSTTKTKHSDTTNSLRRAQRELRELRERTRLGDGQMQQMTDRVKQQMSRIKELESSLVNTTQACAQLEKLLQQEITSRNKLKAENETLLSTMNRLKNQLNIQDKERSANNELIRVLNATLMERETEVSILKLKMTRMQTNSPASMSQFNPPSNPSLVANIRNDPCKAYTMAGRSNSEFTRNSATRSTMMAEAISARSSTGVHLQATSTNAIEDRDAQVWATVPEELTPSRRPVLLEKNLPQLYEQCHNISSSNQSSTPIMRDRRYRTLPRSMKNPLEITPQQQQQNDCDLVDSARKQLYDATVATTTPSTSGIDTKDHRASPTKQQLVAPCLVTNLDESNNTSNSGASRTSAEISSNLADSLVKSSGERTSVSPQSSADLKPVSRPDNKPILVRDSSLNDKTGVDANTTNHYSAINDETEPLPKIASTSSTTSHVNCITLEKTQPPPNIVPTTPSTPVRLSLKKLFSKFKRSGSSLDESRSKTDLRTSVADPPLTPTTSAFQRGATRSTLVGPPSAIRSQASSFAAMDFKTDKPFADWDTNMLVDWLTMIGLSMYANQCRRWVECGAHIMNATPAEVDKGLGITNHLHRKKLRLAISELNGDCDKITKAAAKLDYLWVARWLDDIGVPQYKEAFINARVDGRVLNYLTVEDLVSLGVKSILHHSSIRCGIKVLRSINFNLQLLKRRASAEEIEQMNSMRESMDGSTAESGGAPQIGAVALCDESEVPLWTCHRVMEWLRMIDFAEFAPNLRGSGVHGGLIMYEDGFNIDTMSTLLSIPSSRTLLRRHLLTFFENLIGKDLAQRKKQYKETSSNQQLNPASEIKSAKKSPIWFAKLKSSKANQDGTDEYLCPMYPVEPQIIKSPTRKSDPGIRRDSSNLPRIPESINV